MCVIAAGFQFKCDQNANRAVIAIFSMQLSQFTSGVHAIAQEPNDYAYN